MEQDNKGLDTDADFKAEFSVFKTKGVQAYGKVRPSRVKTRQAVQKANKSKRGQAINKTNEAQKKKRQTIL